MDVRLSAEQRALRDSVAQVVGHLGPATVGALDDAERTAKLDAAVAAAGWRELRSADDAGSPWASGVEVAVIAEQLGRGLADTAFVGPTLAAELRRLAGAPAAGVPETVLLTTDLVALAVTPVGAVALDAAGATNAVVLVPSGEGWSLGSVPLEAATVHTDLTRPAAAAAGEVTPLPGQGRTLDDDDLARVLALGLAATCADLVGAMQGTTDLATGYAKERRQYGAPIGSFQAVQHLLADALVVTEGARSIGLHAAWAVDALDPHEAVAAGAVAKAYAARAARTACEASIQVHGGIGNTWECLAHVFLRRALLSTEVLGGVEANLTRVLDHQLGADRGLR
jgi:alkylation response protein AidB-like acyl-CoA dehydrogenase